MTHALFKLTLLGAAVAISGCAQEMGKTDTSRVYGQSAQANYVRQIAYKNPEDYLIELGRVFAAETQDTVTFAFNASTLDATARRALDSQVAWLKANPGVRMRIEGHTDAVGTESYNDGLGLRRARAVVNYLVRNGISRSRLDAVESFGERQLAVETEERERRNRRSITHVAGFERNFVGDGMDGELAQRIYDLYQATGGQTEAEAESAESGS